ncbi:MAG: hypothetical protein ACRDVZ_06605, partial [Jiangellaceae bacterium]
VILFSILAEARVGHITRVPCRAWVVRQGLAGRRSQGGREAAAVSRRDGPANLVTDMLGLPDVPGSGFGIDADLEVFAGS